MDYSVSWLYIKKETTTIGSLNKKVNMKCSLNKSTNSNDGQTTADSENEPPLLPGLPNHISQLILSTVSPSLLYTVCRRWRRLIYSRHFPPFLSLYAIVADNNGDNSSLSDSIHFFTFDPISGKWTPLPPPPPLRFLRRHPSFISRKLTIQSLSVGNRLVLIAATDVDFLPALSRPVVFDPLTGEWFFGPPLTNPRRWCAAGCIRDTVFVASGVGAHYRGDVARMVEKWDLDRRVDEWRWEEVAGLNDGRFSREAVDAIGYKEEIYMVNMNGNNAGKEGVVYEVKKNRWRKMAAGMVSGWNGAVAVADEEVMYVVEEENGGVRKYNDENDHWEEVIGGSEVLKGAEHVAVGGGKICVVSGGGGRITVVDVVAEPVRMWVVDPPRPESEVVSVHILRRPWWHR